MIRVYFSRFASKRYALARCRFSYFTQVNGLVPGIISDVLLSLAAFSQIRKDYISILRPLFASDEDVEWECVK